MVLLDYEVAEFIHILVAVNFANYRIESVPPVHFVEEHLEEDWRALVRRLYHA